MPSTTTRAATATWVGLSFARGLSRSTSEDGEGCCRDDADGALGPDAAPGVAAIDEAHPRTGCSREHHGSDDGGEPAGQDAERGGDHAVGEGLRDRDGDLDEGDREEDPGDGCTTGDARLVGPGRLGPRRERPEPEVEQHAGAAQERRHDEEHAHEERRPAQVPGESSGDAGDLAVAIAVEWRHRRTGGAVHARRAASPEGGA